MRRIFVPFVLLFALMFAGCTYDDSELVERIEELERSNNVSTLREQVESLTKSITALETLSAKFDELSAKNGADILDLGIEFEQLQEYVEERLDRVETHTAWLEDIIDGKIEDALSGGADVDDKVAELRLWVEGTYATLDQYDALSEDMAQLESALSTIQDDLAAYKQEVEESLGDVDASIGEITEDISQMLESIESLASSITDIQGDIDELQSSMQTWVNEQLSNYYTIAQVDAELQRMEQTIADGDAALAEELVAIFVQLQQSIAEGDEALASEIDKAIAQLEQSIASGDEALASEIDSIFAQLMQSITDGDAAVAAEVKALIEQLSQSITNGDEALATELESMQDDIDAMYESLEQLRADVTSEYRSVIEEVIMENGGVIDTKIKAKIEEVNARVDAELKSLDERVDDLEQRIDALESDINGLDQRLTDIEDALDKIKALDLEFDIEDGVACMAGASIEFGYRVIGGDDDTEVESFGDGGWRTRVTPTDATQGRIKVTAPKDDAEDGKIVVLATSGAGGTCMKAIYFDRGIITDIMDSYETSYMANTLAVTLKTNLEYDVEISAEAQSWISCADTRAELREDTLSFTIEENLYDEPRTAVIHLVGALGDKLQSFEIVQQKSPLNAPIQFADQNVKRVCVEKFDTNGDGELSYREAAAVTEIGGEDRDISFFGDYTSAIKSFDELQYFINLTTIGVGVFYACRSLTSVTIPDSVTTIGWSAFSVCRSLTSVTIPDSVTTIGDGAFSCCSNLTAFYGKFASEDNRCLIVDGVLNSFAQSGLTAYNIPDSVTTIGYHAFYNCDGLTSVTIPDSVTTIGYEAFYHCDGLTSVTIPDSVAMIGNNAFYGCKSLTSVYCKPITPPALNDAVFSHNATGRKIYVPIGSVDAYKSAQHWSEYADDIYEIQPSKNEIWYTNGSTTEATMPYNSNAFGDVTIQSNLYDTEKKCWVITFDGDVTTIGDNAFYSCDSLTSVTIPDSVTTIGGGAFYFCDSLTSVTIPDSVTTIGYSAFSGCRSLTSVTIPDSVTTIGEYAFFGCSSLTSVTIPDSVTTIGYEAFSGCSNLTAFYGKFASEDNRCLIVDGVLNSFAPSGLTAYNIPDSVTTIGVAAFAECYSLTSVTIPDSVTTIGEGAFLECASLTSITILDGVTTIGDTAFGWCQNLTSITIPNSVTTIENWAFGGCSSLVSATIGDGVTTIGEGVFAYCDNIAEFKGKYATENGRCLVKDNAIVAYANASGTEYTIPDDIEMIEKSAFRGCTYLTAVIIPSGVKAIGINAFLDCGNLTEVYCKSTTPPTLGNGAFNTNADDRKIYVPAESVGTYKSAAYWSDYADAIVGYNYSDNAMYRLQHNSEHVSYNYAMNCYCVNMQPLWLNAAGEVIDLSAGAPSNASTALAEFKPQFDLSECFYVVRDDDVMSQGEMDALNVKVGYSLLYAGKGVSIYDNVLTYNSSEPYVYVVPTLYVDGVAKDVAFSDSYDGGSIMVTGFDPISDILTTNDIHISTMPGVKSSIDIFNYISIRDVRGYELLGDYGWIIGDDYNGFANGVSASDAYGGLDFYITMQAPSSLASYVSLDSSSGRIMVYCPEGEKVSGYIDVMVMVKSPYRTNSVRIGIYVS